MNGVYLNETEALKRLGGNKNLYLKLLKSFLGDASYRNLCQQVAAGDRESAKMSAHTLKGLAGNLSLVALSEEAAAVEHRLKEGLLVGQEDLAALEAALNGTVEAIEKLIAAGV